MRPIKCFITSTADGHHCELGDGADQIQGQAKANLMLFVAGVAGKLIYHGLSDVPLEILHTPHTPQNKPRPMEDRS